MCRFCRIQNSGLIFHLFFALPGVWVSAYITNEIHEEILGLQVASRFLLLVTV